jgi:hypothetical protein
VRVALRRFDRGVTERLLHEPHIAGRAQELGRKVMSIVVQSEADDARALAQLLPIRLHASIGERVALAFDLAGVAAAGHVGEDHLGMMPAQRPEDIADRRRDRQSDALAALAELHDLARGPIDFRPAQRDALVEPPTARSLEIEERRVVVAHRGIEPIGFVLG